MAAPLFDNVTDLQKPTASVVMVTPEMAERWLGRNKVNRHVRDRKVSQYARDMAAGEWKLTGEAIKFDQSGRLVDGQHRCTAIVESNATVPMFVIRGLNEDAQTVMDTGSARTASDNLSMQGHKHATTVAAIARRHYGYMFDTDPKSVTNSEVFAYVDANPEIAQAAAIGSRYARHCDLSPAMTGVAAWLIADVHGWEVSEDFFYTAAEKVGLTPSDPVMAMAKFFAEARRARRQLTIDVQLSVIIRAFNYRRANKRVQFIRAEVNGNAVPVPAVAK